MHEEYVFLELNMDTLNSFILFTKYTTNQNQKGKGYAFKDFILDCVWEMTEPENREDRKTMNHYPQHQTHQHHRHHLHANDY